MSNQNKDTLKSYFETGDTPTQDQFSDLIDSLVINSLTASGGNAVDQLAIVDNNDESSFTANIIAGTLSSNRTLTLPDNDGTIALLSDITGGGGGGGTSSSTLDQVLSNGNSTAQEMLFDNGLGDTTTLSNGDIYITHSDNTEAEMYGDAIYLADNEAQTYLNMRSGSGTFINEVTGAFIKYDISNINGALCQIEFIGGGTTSITSESIALINDDGTTLNASGQQLAFTNFLDDANHSSSLMDSLQAKFSHNLGGNNVGTVAADIISLTAFAGEIRMYNKIDTNEGAGLLITKANDGLYHNVVLTPNIFSIGNDTNNFTLNAKETSTGGAGFNIAFTSNGNIIELDADNGTITTPNVLVNNDLTIGDTDTDFWVDISNGSINLNYNNAENSLFDGILQMVDEEGNFLTIKPSEITLVTLDNTDGITLDWPTDNGTLALTTDTNSKVTIIPYGTTTSFATASLTTGIYDYVFSGGTGENYLYLPTGTNAAIGVVVNILDLDGIADSNPITIDAGSGNTITYQSAPTQIVNILSPIKGAAIKLTKVTATHWMGQ